MLRKIFLAAITAMGFYVSNAQDSTMKVSYSGGVDGYYRYNFNNQPNNYTSFTNSQSSFELGMATLKADATAMSGKVGAVVDLGFGRRAEEFSYNDGVSDAGKNGFASLAFIKQAYITYAPTKKLKFTAGKFATHVGYELLDAPLNRNYSMSYMFTNGPFFHTGIKADIVAGPIGLMVGLSNYTDQSTATTSAKNFIAQASYVSKSEKIKAYLNYSGFAGADSGKTPSTLKSVHQIDAMVNYIINKKFSLGYNGTIQSRKPIVGSSGSWVGNALYVNFDPSNKIGLTLRSEYISDDKTVYFTTKNIFANTLSLNYKVGPLTIIPELRFESANSNFYIKEDGSGTKSTGSGLVAVVYKF
jgi:Putative beta-barrel porin-2, OmpL-like. bbp2